MRRRTRIAGLIVTFGLTLAVVANDSIAQVRPGAPRRGAAVLAQEYREALRAALPPEAAARIEAVEIGRARRMRASALAFATADHAVRRFAPLAVDASGKTSQSPRLRSLRPIDSVTRAQQARTSIALTIAALQSSATMSRQPRIEAAMEALRAAEAAVVLATQLAQECTGVLSAYDQATCATNALRSVTEAANVAAHAREAGADDEQVVLAALQSLRDLNR